MAKKEKFTPSPISAARNASGENDLGWNDETVMLKLNQFIEDQGLDKEFEKWIADEAADEAGLNDDWDDWDDWDDEDYEASYEAEGSE